MSHGEKYYRKDKGPSTKPTVAAVAAKKAKAAKEGKVKLEPIPARFQKQVGGYITQESLRDPLVQKQYREAVEREKEAVMESRAMAKSMPAFFKATKWEQVQKGAKKVAAKTFSFMKGGVKHSVYMVSPHVVWYTRGKESFMYVKRGADFYLKKITSGKPMYFGGEVVYKFDQKNKGTGDSKEFLFITSGILSVFEAKAAQGRRISLLNDVAGGLTK